jgi:hypothetical protein
MVGAKRLTVSLKLVSKSSRTGGLFDAMPAFWKYMPAEQRRLVVALIYGWLL